MGGKEEIEEDQEVKLNLWQVNNLVTFIVDIRNNEMERKKKTDGNSIHFSVQLQNLN